jgi:ribonuclease E
MQAPVVETVVEAKSEPTQQTAPQPVQQELVETAPAAAEKPERKPRAPRRPKAAAKPAAVDLASAGLELVETRSSAAPAVAEEKPAPRKSGKTAAWQKKAAAEKAADEPLVMIETQK